MPCALRPSGCAKITKASRVVGLRHFGRFADYGGDHRRRARFARRAQAMSAHTFWRARGFKADLVILNEQASGYNQDFTETLHKAAIVHAADSARTSFSMQPGGVFMRTADNCPKTI